MEKGPNQEARPKKEGGANKEDQPVKLRPIVYSTSSFKKGAPNKIQQMLLVKALQVTSDPKELRRMIGVKTVADVYRTLDKLALRKDYHQALEDNGLSFDYMVKNLKQVIDGAEKDSDKINAVKTLLKSVGMDKYEGDSVGAAGSWEDALIEAADKKRAEIAEENGGEGVEMQDLLEADYEVEQPDVPDYVKKIQEEEKALGKSLYED